MKCEKCGNAIANGELFCKECGHEQAYHQQRNKLLEAEYNLKNFIRKKCHSPLFLFIAICFTLTTVFNIGNTLPFIFMLITTIGLWRCYSAKSDDALVKGLKNFKAYDMYQKVCYYILIAIFSVCFVLYTFSIVSGCYNMNNAGGPNITTSSLIAWFIGLVVFGVIIAILEIFVGIYKRRLEFVDILKISVINGTHYPLSFSKVGSYFIGILIIISSISSVISTILSSGSIIGMADQIEDLFKMIGADPSFMSEFNNIIVSLSAFYGIITVLSIVGSILGCLGSICFAIYYILTAEWMGAARDECFILVKKVDEAKKALAEIEKETRRQVIQFNQSTSPEVEDTEDVAPEIPASNIVNNSADESIAYSIAINGKASSPISVKELREMALSGELLPESKLWKRGMTAWVRADEIEELIGSFPPPIDMPEETEELDEIPEIPAEEVTAEESIVNDAVIEEALVEEITVEEATIEEAPVEEAPVEEKTVEEATVEEATVEEAPEQENQEE